jgi:crossover junction endodeoxyribonuclease RuvC
MSKKTIILGIDPSVNHMGWGVISVQHANSALYIASGTIFTNRLWSTGQKLAKIFTQLNEIITQHEITDIALETVFLDKDLVATLSLSYARAIIMMLASQNNIELAEVHASNVKKTVSGSGRASKEQIQYMIQTLLKPAKPETQDESDALAIAYTCFINSTTASRLLI